MNAHMRFVFTCVIAVPSLAMLKGCGSAPATVAPASTALSSPATSAPAGTPLSTIPFSDSALVAIRDPKTNALELAPVDPANGQVLKGYKPVGLGAMYAAYNFTRDRKMLLFVTYASSDYPSKATLHFLDLSSWQENQLELPVSGWISASAVSPDGTLFAVAPVEQKGTLWLIDVRSHTALVHIQTPYLATAMQFSSDNRGLMVYARHEDPNNMLSQGASTAELLSTQDLSSVWSVELKNVRDGFEPNPGFTGGAFEPGAGTTYRPGIVFSPNADTLYVLHADVDRLTTVDFAARSLSTLKISPKVSWFDRLLMFGADIAYAKEQSGVERWAVISPDGQTLYIAGMQNLWTKNQSGNSDLTETPLNLQAVRVSDAAQIFKSEATGRQLQVSPDGRSLFVTQWNDFNGDVGGTLEVDSASGAVLQRYDKLYLQLTQHMDGSLLLVSARPGSTNQFIFDMLAYTPDHQLVGKWPARADAAWMIDP